MEKEKTGFLGKYREIIVYIIVGIINTIFCWGFNWILTLFMDASIPFINFLMQTISWCAGVSFAFPLNRKWVFRSTNPKWLDEFIKFAGSRISTWILDVVIMIVFVNIWPFVRLSEWAKTILNRYGINMSAEDINYWFVKIFISAVLVMIFNYIFSKLFVFKKEKITVEESK